jgi:hypothetical protein
VSAVKYQLQRLLPSLVSQAQGISDPEVKKRFKFLKVVGESKKSVRKKCREEGKSHQQFYKWAEILVKTKNVLNLKSRSRRPKKSPNKTVPRIERKIRKLRELEPFQGAERISQDLSDLFGIRCPPSTVFAVLKREGYVGKEQAKQLTKRHFRRYRRPLPGYLQMDFKYVPYLIEGKQFYQLSCVDHCSSWRFMRAYMGKDQWCVRAFLNELYENCPFPIMQIQTDNDVAFTDKFSSQTGEPTGNHLMDQWCKRYDIEHKLIPVGQKELNGKVENTHKQDDREHFSQIHCLTFDSLDIHTRLYNERWNERRKTKALGWKTPWEAVLEGHIRAWAYLMQMHAHFSETSECTRSEVDQGRRELALVPQPASAAVDEPRPKRVNYVDRYLQYVDWENRKRLKTLLLPVAMSLSYSRR